MLPFNANLHVLDSSEYRTLWNWNSQFTCRGFLGKMECKTRCLFRYLNNFETKIILTKRASDWWFALAWHFWYPLGQALMSHPENSSIFSWLCNAIYIFMIMQYSLYLNDHGQLTCLAIDLTTEHLKLMILGIDQLLHVMIHTRIEWDVTAWSVQCCVTLLAVEKFNALQGIVWNLK